MKPSEESTAVTLHPPQHVTVDPEQPNTNSSRACRSFIANVSKDKTLSVNYTTILDTHPNEILVGGV